MVNNDNLNSNENKKNKLPTVLCTASILGALALGIYNLNRDNNESQSVKEEYANQLVDIKSQYTKQLEKLTNENTDMNTRVSKLDSTLIGISENFTGYLDLNGDFELDKIKPLTSQFSFIQYGYKNRIYSQDYLRSYSYMEDIIHDYLLGSGKKLPAEHVAEVYRQNPMILCDVKAIAKILKIWPESGILNDKYTKAYTRINSSLGGVECNPK